MMQFSIRLGVACLVFCVSATACFAAAQQPDILYLNRCTAGCTIHFGADNAVMGQSTLVTGTRTVAAFPGTDAIFDQTAACVRHVFLPFNIHVVTTNPGSAPRREMMLTTTGGTLDANYSGLGAITTYDGNPHDNVIGFVFATTIGSADVNALCQTTAQTVAFLYGLEYVVNHCVDIEDSSIGCGEKSFANFDSTCDGTLFSGNPGHCLLGNTTQNSYATLLSVAGASDFILANSFEGFEVPHAGPSP